MNNDFKKPFKALLIDFGGVLYDIDTDRTVSAFKALLSANSQANIDISPDLQINYQSMPFMAQYERGDISSKEFIDIVSNQFGITNKQVIIDAWNSTLIGFKTNIDRVLAELADDYPLYLLSNTNDLHHSYFAEDCEVIFKYFKHLYFSYQVGMQKPNQDIFQKVLEDTKLNPEDILFVDDVYANIQAAQSLNIATYHVDEVNNTMYKLSDYLHTV